MEASLKDRSLKYDTLEGEFKEITQKLAQSSEEKSEHLRKIEELLLRE